LAEAPRVINRLKARMDRIAISPIELQCTISWG
jgi:hypothetical protein